jgi:hypothetical protein
VGWARHLPPPANTLLFFSNKGDSNVAGKGGPGRHATIASPAHADIVDPPEGSTDPPLEDTNWPTEQCIRPRTCQRRRSPPLAQCARFPVEMSCCLPPCWCRASPQLGRRRGRGGLKPGGAARRGSPVLSAGMMPIAVLCSTNRFIVHVCTSFELWTSRFEEAVGFPNILEAFLYFTKELKLYI